MFPLMIMILSLLVASFAERNRTRARLPPHPIDSLILGKYELLSYPTSKDYKDYLTAMHVTPLFQEIMSRLKFNIEITKNETEYQYEAISPFTVDRIRFIPEERIVNTYFDGRIYNTTFRFEGNDTVMQQLQFDETDYAYTRHVFTSEGMTAHFMMGDTMAERKYKRVATFDV